jgi:hypothetical protein
MSFLKAHNIRGLAKKNDWPSYTEEEPEIYEQEELEKLFAACDTTERNGWRAGAGGHALLLVRHQLHGSHGSRHPQARSGLDAKSLQGADDSNSRTARG